MAGRKQKVKKAAIDDLLEVMARLRAPDGCPWDREQDHRSIRLNAVEEVYELVDAIEAGDDTEMEEELGDRLLQVVFHAQMAKERGAFDFEAVARGITEKLIRRHPHVFGDTKVADVDETGTEAQEPKTKKQKVAEKNDPNEEFANAEMVDLMKSLKGSLDNMEQSLKSEGFQKLEVLSVKSPISAPICTTFQKKGKKYFTPPLPS